MYPHPGHHLYASAPSTQALSSHAPTPSYQALPSHAAASSIQPPPLNPSAPFFQAQPSHPSALSFQDPPPHFPKPLPQLTPRDVSLWIRQDPEEALVCAEGKEKMRKPVDPPPIIQLKIKSNADPLQHYLQSPYLFMSVSLWDPERDEAVPNSPSKSLAGSLISSLHRLKDIDNKDGAFFVFGDISVKIKGTFRLRFTLFDLQKQVPDSNVNGPTQGAVFLATITSRKFRVESQKDFKGLGESSYLSRAFSDQGVRLRLRKEARTMTTKRGHAQIGSEFGGGSSSKRLRVGSEEADQKDQRCEDGLPQYYSAPSHGVSGAVPNGMSGAVPHSIGGPGWTDYNPFPANQWGFM